MVQSLILEKTFPAPGIHLCGMAWDGHSTFGTPMPALISCIGSTRRAGGCWRRYPA